MGEFLKDYRTSLRAENPTLYTQLAVAKKCGYTSSQHISNIERGLALPSIALANKLIKLYSIPREEMYEMFMKHREAQYRKAFLSRKKSN